MGEIIMFVTALLRGQKMAMVAMAPVSHCGLKAWSSFWRRETLISFW
jgi:hypothetical protein